MTVLFMGFAHRQNDPRLFYREMVALRARDSSCRIFFLTRLGLFDMTNAVDRGGGEGQPIHDEGGMRGVRAISSRIASVRRIRPSVIQASHAVELPWAFFLGLLTNAPVVYDSHEDYFRMAFEYGGRKLRGLLTGIRLAFTELALARFCEAVFCTDEFLLARYQQRRFGCRRVHLLRNYPGSAAISQSGTYDSKQTLDLVYIGGVNEHRGVRECADYVARFNSKWGPGRSLRFTVYSPPGELVQQLSDAGLLRHVPWIGYDELMRVLPRFDVGVCLWMPNLLKFHRNIPLKNFDYMAAGLPVVTSDFGNIARYARASGGALCIDPTSYDAFEESMTQLFQPEVRRRLGEAGRVYIRKEASFEREAVTYVETMLSLARRAVTA